MTWKAAIARAWKLRGRRHIIRAIVVASVTGIGIGFATELSRGLLIWAALSAVMFAINIGDDTRLQRKEARKEAARVSD
ncbi:hypothetical protein [Arthrobacter sp. UYCo732]|uniref:hypothetical protein n=1 Tax=Arthrobacter sp. UYCo732 TaxID=3156336 RepID=UPI003393FE8E